MKAVVQRVKDASVRVEDVIQGSIVAGLLVYLGVGRDDTEKDALWLVDKITGLRIFEDAAGKMNLSLLDTGGGVLTISQFTLLADTRKGRRPSFANAAEPAKARELYDFFRQQLALLVLDCASGSFGAEMQVSYTNVGPVTILLDTKE